MNNDLALAQESYNAAALKVFLAARATYMKDQFVIPVENPDESLYLNKSITGAPASFAYIYEPSLAKLGSSRMTR